MFVPLRIKLSVCADPEIWLEDVRAVLEQEFSDGYTPDGRLGFFHPDAWTFGQTLHASQILGRLEQVQGDRRRRVGRGSAAGTPRRPASATGSTSARTRSSRSATTPTTWSWRSTRVREAASESERD